MLKKNERESNIRKTITDGIMNFFSFYSQLSNAKRIISYSAMKTLNDNIISKYSICVYSYIFMQIIFSVLYLSHFDLANPDILIRISLNKISENRTNLHFQTPRADFRIKQKKSTSLDNLLLSMFFAGPICYILFLRAYGEIARKSYL